MKPAFFVACAMTTLIIINAAAAQDKILDLYVKPKINGVSSPNTAFTYTFAFTDSELCADVLLSKSAIVTTDSDGIAHIPINISSLANATDYICEYRNGVLRAVHNWTMPSWFYLKDYPTQLSNFTNDIVNTTQSEDSGGIWSINTTWLYDTVSGWIEFPTWDQSLNTTDNVTFNNITVTGNLTVGSGTLFVDAVNNNVGIGTTTPVDGLQVGSDAAGLNVSIKSTLGPELAPALTAGNWTLSADWRYLTSPDRLEKYAEGVGTATPTSSMGVTIGKTYKVVITVDEMSAMWMEFKLGGSAGKIAYTAGTYTYYITAVTTENLVIFATRSASRFSISSVSVIELSDGNLELNGLTVKGPSLFSGRVGIGATAPRGTLDVTNGNDNQKEVNIYFGSYGALGQTDYGTAWGTVDKGLIMGNNAHGGVQGYRITYDSSGYGYRAMTMDAFGMYFYAINGATTADALISETAKRMGILNSGYVGIGSNSTTAVSTLDLSSATTPILTLRRVDTSINANDLIGQIDWYAKDDSTTTTFTPASIRAYASNTIASDINPGYLSFWTTPEDVAGALTERMRIDASGNVGIGTTIPTQKLDVNGSASITGNLSADSGTFFVDAEHDMVGIGTTIPTRPLMVAGSTMIYKGTPLVYADPEAVDLAVTNSAGDSRFFFGQATSAFGGFNWLYNSDVMLSKLQLGWGMSGMTFLRNKNVGVGTDYPTANFQVDQSTTGPGGRVSVSGTTVSEVLPGSMQFTNTFKVGDTITVTTTAGSETKTITSITSDASLETEAFAGTASNAYYYLAGNNNTLAVKGYGYVGIGTNNPTQKLDVNGSANIAGNLTVNSNTLYVDAVNNRIGIGTDTPNVALNVIGSANVTGNMTVGESATITGNLTASALNISSVMFIPTDTAPQCIKGMVYYDDSMNDLCQCNSTDFVVVGTTTLCT
ncbi:MAG: hypothetical protein V1648_03695 [Candidatus Aenigmatarchaeota archaeon]